MITGVSMKVGVGIISIFLNNPSIFSWFSGLFFSNVLTLDRFKNISFMLVKDLFEF